MSGLISEFVDDSKVEVVLGSEEVCQRLESRT